MVKDAPLRAPRLAGVILIYSRASPDASSTPRRSFLGLLTFLLDHCGESAKPTSA